MSLLVVGSVAIDNVETPDERRENVLGGSARIFLTPPAFSPTCGWWAWSATIGPTEHTQLLNSRGIDTSGLQVVPGGKTFRWTGKYQPNMNDRETLEVQLNVLRPIQPGACPKTIAGASTCSWPTARRWCR